MGWIHKGTNGETGTANAGHGRLSREESARLREEQERKEAAAASEYERLVLERESRESSEFARILSVAVAEAKEGDYAHDPKEEPTDEEISSLLTWFGKKEGGMPFLTSFLAERGWNTLEDLWEIREALLLAQTRFFNF